MEDGAYPAGPLTVILMEEPESALHPGAQSELAGTLRDWSTHGLQLMVVTHNPSLVNAAPPGGIRLAKLTPADEPEDKPARTVTRPVDLDE